MRTVCLLTAGTGSRMGHYSEVTNKCLLPVKNKALISYIIEQFPIETKFVVALGYKKSLVRQYLNLAHPDRSFIYVDVWNYDGYGSGPAHSVDCCKEHLMDGFTLMTCDGLYQHLAALPTDRNVIGISPIAPEDSPSYCNVGIEHGKVLTIVDKQYYDSGWAACGVYHIQDVHTFFANLKGTELSSGFSALLLDTIVINWEDAGTHDKYEAVLKESYGSDAFDGGKTDELLYMVNDRIIKVYKDDTIVNHRVQRAEGRSYFPTIDFHSDHIYSYRLVPGLTLYQYNTPELFLQLLNWMEMTVWPDLHTEHSLQPQDCIRFYHDKTLARLAQFRQRYPDFNPGKVNNTKIPIIMETALGNIRWDDIFYKRLLERTAFIHGDFQFDNVLYDGSTKKFVLIDWRQDFAGQTHYGDKYYDIAKLKAGLLLNHDLIKKRAFMYEEKANGQVVLDYATRVLHQDMHRRLNISYPDPMIDEMVSLIYLNMAPLHNPPFDKLLFCLALQRLGGTS